MNYLQFVNTILETSKSHKLVYEVGEGDIYEHLNSGDHKYPCVFLTVQNVDSNGSQMTVTGSLFYVDALLSDTSNKLQIQATGMTTLQQIFMRLMDNYPDFDLRIGRYTPFDEKFSDLCSGVFSNFTISFMDDICIVNDDIFEGDIPTPPTPPGPEPPTPPTPEGKYMTITVLDGDAGTTISPTVTGTLSPNLQYRVNNGSWTDFIVGNTADIQVVAGDFVQFKGVNESGISTSSSNYLNFAIYGNPVALSGNIMSLIDGVGDALEIPNSYCFYRLFINSNIKTVSSDFLPATTIAKSCYGGMFYGCTSLTTAPALPATTLSDNCYYSMFNGCTALTTAPALPATTLAGSCYQSMFNVCTALTTAPELPATTLADNCYYSMFNGCTALTTAPALPATTLMYHCYTSMFYRCTSLTQAPELPATTLATDCYYGMFGECKSLVTAPELPATKLANLCYSNMFNGCTALTTAPELPATTLMSHCYTGMFYRCTALTTAPVLPATTLENYCYQSMFNGCTSLTQAPELPATQLVDNCYAYMFKNCNNLNYVKCLATDITATNALTDWLSGVASSGTFVKEYGVEYLTNSPSGIPSGWTVEEINVPIPPEPEGKYMTITVDDNAGETTISPSVTGSLPNLNLQYRINNREWNDFIVGTTADIQVVAGDFVQFKGVNESGVSTSENDYLNFSISGLCHLSGNVMSLIDGVGDALEIPNDYCFYKMFSTSNVKTVSSDFLPATTLKNDCYSNMFLGCTALTTAPELPATTLAERCYSCMFSSCISLTQAPTLHATTLANSCYYFMFSGCSSLTQAPMLPATTIANSCYMFMFNGCTALTQGPELPATTLADYCYTYMFSACTSLTTAPVLPATTLAGSCYSGMFQGCTSLVDAPALPVTTLANYCYQSMFNGCTALTTAPELPATMLVDNCYTGMFQGCTSLTQAPELPATTLANYCYQSMFSGCTSIVTAPELPATQLVYNCYTYMFKNCNNLNYMKCLATEITATDALKDWLSGVASSGTFVKKYGVEYLTNSPSGIPQGWTVEEIDAPIQPEGKYMTITVDDSVEGEAVIKPTVTGSITPPNLQYRINSNGDWTDFVFGTTADIKVVAGDFVQWKGNNTSGVSTSENDYLNFSISGLCHLSGNVMSLIDGVGDALEIPNSYCFYSLFINSKIKTVSSDFLPATTLANGCYYSMFQGCTSLTTAPELPATTLADMCYVFMFANCTSLVNAHVLPATTLANMCYSGMFSGCTALTTAPVLPATTLVGGCYGAMFSGCTSLATAPALPATTLADGCYMGMFFMCSSLVNAPELSATTLANMCYYNIFNGCTALTTAPELPATTLADNCYNEMFQGCTSLTTAPVLTATTLADSCYQSMFKNCNNLNYMKCLATDITATDALKDWLSGVASTGTFVKEYGVEYLINSPSGIPRGWTVEEIDVPIPPEPEPKYMTITVGAGANGTTIAPTLNGSFYPLPNLQYRINNGNWTKFIFSVNTDDIHLVSGDVIQFKGVNKSGISDSGANYLNFAISGNPVALSGNVMSLIDGVGDALVIPNNYCFYGLFMNSNVKTVSSDFLPATTLARICYQHMFKGCTSLVNAPELPSTTLANGCYNEMFRGCTSLTTAPALPATTLAESCYGDMFEGCTSLKTAPEILPATTLAPYCYYGMFLGCTSLTTAPALPATTLAESCYNQMFSGCTSLTTAPALPATTLASNCYSSMFSSCEALKTAPELPATTLTEWCYSHMFQGCSKLQNVKCLATEGTIEDDGTHPNSLYGWLEWVSSTGTFIKPAGVSYVTGDSGIPEGWTIQNI